MKDSKIRKEPLTPRPYLKRPSDRVQEAIEEAMANGAFDNLPGAGKPLDFSDDDNPYVPADMRLAYRMLRKHGYVLPWIDDRREIEKRRAELDQQVSRHLERLRRTAEDTHRLSPQLQHYHREKLKAQHADFCREHLAAIEALNRRIDSYNLAVPNVTLQTHRVNRERVLRRLDQERPEIAS